MLELTVGRKIDAVALTIGGNDVGFRSIVAALVAHGHPALSVRYSDIDEAFRSGDFPKLRREIGIEFDVFMVPGIRMERVDGFDKLPGLYKEVAEKLREAGVSDSSVYISLYPTPFWTLQGGVSVYCDQMLHLDSGVYKVRIDHEEINWADANILSPLNQSITTAARDNGWNLLDRSNLLARSEGRGLCSNPYEYPGNSPDWQDNYPGTWFPSRAPSPASLDPGLRWFRNAREAFRVQGGAHRKETTGTLHPNEYGHISMAQDFLCALKTVLFVAAFDTTEKAGC